ncbi:MAG: hypothetical protein JXB85_14475 [Anaerolineales bacterium]|nr:hypothetical protein [Anaerolineales bacterium]
MKNNTLFHPLARLALSLFLVIFATALPPAIPVTAGGNGDQENPSTSLPTLGGFAAQMRNGNSSQISGIYAEGLLALPVVQQPAGQPGFVATQSGTVTQFGMASGYGSYGFLAHNYLAGSQFFNITTGILIHVVYGDGHYETFQVSQVRRFQATSPRSPYSNFIDLETNLTLTATQLFHQTYGVAGQTILQTCIEANDDDSWGRLFIIASPYTSPPSNAY